MAEELCDVLAVPLEDIEQDEVHKGDQLDEIVLQRSSGQQDLTFALEKARIYR